MTREALMQRIEQTFDAKCEKHPERVAKLLEDICWQVDQWAREDERQAQEWQPIETAPKDMASRLYLIGRYCVQGFVDAAGELMVQSEVSPHWRKMRGKPTHWMPLPSSPVSKQG